MVLLRGYVRGRERASVMVPVETRLIALLQRLECLRTVLLEQRLKLVACLEALRAHPSSDEHHNLKKLRNSFIASSFTPRE